MVAGGGRPFIAATCIYAGKNKLAEIHVLKNAHHAFDQNPGSRVRYDPGGSKMLYSGSATTKSEELTKAFLAKHLGN